MYHNKIYVKTFLVVKIWSLELSQKVSRIFFTFFFYTSFNKLYAYGRWFEGAQATKNIQGKDLHEEITVSMAEPDIYMCERTMPSYTFPSATVSERAHIYTQSMG